MKIAKEPISLETPVGDEDDSHLGDFIETKMLFCPLMLLSLKFKGYHNESSCYFNTKRREGSKNEVWYWYEYRPHS